MNDWNKSAASAIEIISKTLNRFDMNPSPTVCGYGFVSFSADDPANTFLPPLNVTVEALATNGAFFADHPVTVTTSPSLSEFLVQPRLISPFGLASSKSQLLTLPFSSLTSI